MGRGELIGGTGTGTGTPPSFFFKQKKAGVPATTNKKTDFPIF